MRFKLAWLIIAAWFVGFLVVPGDLVADGFSKHMKNAENFMSKGEFESAVTEYQEALKGKPNSVKAQSWLGMANEQLGDSLFSKGKTDQAIEAYKNALASVPEDPYWHAQLGKALEKKGDRDATIKEYRSAAELSPLDSELQSQYEKFIGGPQGAVGAGFGTTKTGERIQTVSGEVSAPRAIHHSEPSYSDRARQAKLQGTVSLWAVIDREGNVVDTKITKPLGFGLDVKALEAIRTWKFHPATRNGYPVSVRVEVEVEFRLY